jgi:hypothetical protein
MLLKIRQSARRNNDGLWKQVLALDGQRARLEERQVEEEHNEHNYN